MFSLINFKKILTYGKQKSVFNRQLFGDSKNNNQANKNKNRRKEN